MTPAECLNAAADLLEREGWCQYRFGDYNGPRCLDSALVEAAMSGPGSHWVPPEPYVRALEALQPRVGCLTTWNDVAGRTKDEVLTLLRETAASLEVQS